MDIVMSAFTRLRTILSWLFLCANLLLCVILLRSWYLTFDNKTSIDTNIAKIAAEYGSYYLCQYGDPSIYLKVKGNIENNNNLMKNALFGIGKDVAVSCDYSIGNEGQVQEIRLLKNDESFSDLNADGRFNTHIVLWPKEKLRLDAWYKGKWQEIDREKSEGMGKYQHVLKENGEVVVFDKEIGQWIPKTDKQQPKSEDVKP
jgi:hypothetical protein